MSDRPAPISLSHSPVTSRNYPVKSRQLLSIETKDDDLFSRRKKIVVSHFPPSSEWKISTRSFLRAIILNFLFSRANNKRRRTFFASSRGKTRKIRNLIYLLWKGARNKTHSVALLSLTPPAFVHKRLSLATFTLVVVLIEWSNASACELNRD